MRQFLMDRLAHFETFTLQVEDVKIVIQGMLWLMDEEGQREIFWRDIL